MVKFGRHVDFFVGDPTRRRLYVVPYKDVQRRTCNDLLHPPYSSPPPPLPPPPPPDLTTTTTTTISSISPPRPSRSGLSELFDCEHDGGYGVDDDDDYNINGNDCAEEEEEEEEGEFANFFLSQRFQNEWRRCHRRASDDFDSAMKTFWGEVSRRDRLYIRPLVRGGSIISFRFFLFFGPNPYIYYNREGI